MSNPENPKKKKEKYMWLGYGGYGGAGQPNPEIEFPASVSMKNPNLVAMIQRLFRRKEKDPQTK